MSSLPYTLDQDAPDAAPLGLIVLQADETIEPEFRRYFASSANPVYVSRVPSGQTLTHKSITHMQTELVTSANLLPKGLAYPVVGYGCTSASAIIGSDEVERLVQKSCNAASVTNPLRATVKLCATKGVSRLALISPYVEEVSEPLRGAFAKAGIDFPTFGSFDESVEANVVRISAASIIDAALKLGADADVEGVFLSCTNLRTFDLIKNIENQLGKPVISSNRALAWHMQQLASI